MEVKNLQRIEKRNISISIRISKKHSNFMKDKNISPTKLFISSVEELMDEEE